MSAMEQLQLRSPNCPPWTVAAGCSIKKPCHHSWPGSTREGSQRGNPITQATPQGSPSLKNVARWRPAPLDRGAGNRARGSQLNERVQQHQQRQLIDPTLIAETVVSKSQCLPLPYSSASGITARLAPGLDHQTPRVPSSSRSVDLLLQLFLRALPERGTLGLDTAVIWKSLLFVLTTAATPHSASREATDHAHKGTDA